MTRAPTSALPEPMTSRSPPAQAGLRRLLHAIGARALISKEP